MEAVDQISYMADLDEIFFKEMVTVMSSRGTGEQILLLVGLAAMNSMVVKVMIF